MTIWAKYLLLLADHSIRIKSYELYLLFKVDWFLSVKFLYMEWSGTACKIFQRANPNHFWQIFSFFHSFYYRPNIYFYWPTFLSESTHMNCASSTKVTASLEINVLTWKYQVFVANNSKKCTPNHFWKIFCFFFTHFTIDYIFTFTLRAICPNRLIWIVCLLKAWPSPWK